MVRGYTVERVGFCAPPGHKARRRRCARWRRWRTLAGFAGANHRLDFDGGERAIIDCHFIHCTDVARTGVRPARTVCQVERSLCLRREGAKICLGDRNAADIHRRQPASLVECQSDMLPGWVDHNSGGRPHHCTANRRCVRVCEVGLKRRTIQSEPSTNVTLAVVPFDQRLQTGDRVRPDPAFDGQAAVRTQVKVSGTWNKPIIGRRVPREDRKESKCCAHFARRVRSRQRQPHSHGKGVVHADAVHGVAFCAPPCDGTGRRRDAHRRW